jgi:uncharacterized cupredoxin-like copper-binding protein
MIHRFAVQCLAVYLAVAVFGTPLADSSPQHSNVVTFSASDHRFDGPDQLPAGQTTVRLRNHGKEPHQLQLLKLDHGKSPADLAAVLKSGDRSVPSWAKHMGGPNGVDAGQSSEATLYLEPGSYVVICAIPGKNHQSHAALGMQKALRVLDTKPAPPDFHGNFHMAMFEYEFVVVQPLRKGRHSFYVVNRGNQVHQASSRLPGTLIGGMSGLEPGRDGTFTAELTPGRYVIMCLFAVPPAGESHAAKGMVMNFTIE